MAYLFRYECRPNYPVCDGEVIFFMPTDSTEEAMAWLEKEMKIFFGYFGQDASLILMGTFEPSIEFKPWAPDYPNVFSCQNGEY